MWEIVTLGLWSILLWTLRILYRVIASHGVLLRGLLGGAANPRARQEKARAQQASRVGF
jgi:hypothetical protein